MEQLEAPPVEYSLEPHDEQYALPEVELYVPAAQSGQAEAPEEEDFPGGQLSQEVEPVEEAKRPLLHREHVTVPATSLNLPAGHS